MFLISQTIRRTTNSSDEYPEPRQSIRRTTNSSDEHPNDLNDFNDHNDSNAPNPQMTFQLSKPNINRIIPCAD
jgi:hypothetical protein